MSQLIRRGGLLVAALCAATALLAPAASVAKTKTKYRTVYTTKTVSFSGTCTFSMANLDFSPGLKIDEANQTGTLEANGDCGSLGAGHLVGTVTGIANCTGGKAPFTGTGSLTLNSTTVVPVKLSIDIHLPSGNFTMSGMVSGSASASANYVQPGNAGGMFSCGGNGLQNASFPLTLTSQSPVTSTVRVAHKVAIKPKKK